MGLKDIADHRDICSYSLLTEVWRFLDSFSDLLHNEDRSGALVFDTLVPHNAAI